MQAVAGVDMEYLIFAIALVLVLLVLMLKGYADYKRDEKQFIRQVSLKISPTIL